MLTNIKLSNKIKKELSFHNINDLEHMNVLFGQQKISKLILLNAIQNREFELDTKTDIVIKSFHSKHVNETEFYNQLIAFLRNIEAMSTDKDIIVLINEIDENLGSANVMGLLTRIQNLINTKNVQFFISTNHFLFILHYHSVINMRNGKRIIVKSKQQYRDILNNHSERKRVYNYVAVLTRDTYYRDLFIIHFPDLPDCATASSAIYDNFRNDIQATLRHHIMEELRQGRTLPIPSKIQEIKISEGQFIMNVKVQI